MGGRTLPYILLGAGYGVLAVVLVVFAAVRQRAVRRALDEGSYLELADRWMLGFTAAAVVLALGTLVLVVVQF